MLAKFHLPQFLFILSAFAICQNGLAASTAKDWAEVSTLTISRDSSQSIGTYKRRKLVASRKNRIFGEEGKRPVTR